MNLNRNNLIFSGNNKEFESVFVLKKIRRLISHHCLQIRVVEIDCLSKKSMELSMKYNINTVPFAIYKKSVYTYKAKGREDEVDNQILDFLKI